ncbi:MAG: 30S ribosomal protein S3 [Candidatus Paceibacterota bacterium]|jgi:small subunit ribosomal protein S3|nr:30S ribosomal protein S3 [Candidatus Paceibacterota bacterium]MDD4830785.1 30S ribosomal protein S3 [Candidatus Paceibacterota bacterium]MDD4875293.1 30S ribosomal protein S3 [Candidatus Paceibacterota bacterium]
MAHKVNPKLFRIRQNSDWLSQGYYGKSPKSYLEEDFQIRETLKSGLKDASVEKIEIERFPREDKTNILIYTARPGLVIGRRGEGIELLKVKLIKALLKGKKLSQKERELKFKKTNIEIKEIADPWLSAALVAQWVAQRLEKRMPFRKLLKQALDKIMVHKEVEGSRIEVSGRLDGAAIARREWLKKGQLPRGTIRADIDYGFEEARCTYGTIGIKVWICKGEKFDQ